MGTSMIVHRKSSGGSSGGGGGLPKLIERQITVSVAANGTQYIPIDTGYDKYDIRTISVTSDTSTNHSVAIHDKRVDGIKIYQSLDEPKTYDILNIPCHDKDGDQVCHVSVSNKGGSAGMYTVIIKFTNLL